MTGWNGQSWLLSAKLPEQTILTWRSGAYVLVTLGFLVGVIGVYSDRTWANHLPVISALLSSLILITLWDGSFDRLLDKGVLGWHINTGILGYVYLVD